MLWAGLRCWQKKPLVSYGIGWFFIAIAPASNILVPINAVLYEHFLYLPMIGVVLIVVDAAMEWGRRKNLGPTLLKVLVLVLIIFISMNLKLSILAFVYFPILDYRHHAYNIRAGDVRDVISLNAKF